MIASATSAIEPLERAIGFRGGALDEDRRATRLAGAVSPLMAKFARARAVWTP